MRLSLYQFPTKWMDPETNLKSIAKVCEAITGQSDMLILPEMFNTGYTMKPGEIPADWQDETIETLTNLASQYKLAFCGSIPMIKFDRWYNTMIIVSKEGLEHSYDKIHLFTPAGEKDVYAEGQITSSFLFHDWKIKPLICYDLRFPYLAFNQEIPDMVVYSANWPDTRVSHWKALLKARAIENQCYVVGVNRTGKDENGFDYPGASTIIDYSGQILQEMDEKEGFFTQKIDKDEMTRYRNELPFLNDRKII